MSLRTIIVLLHAASAVGLTLNQINPDVQGNAPKKATAPLLSESHPRSVPDSVLAEVAMKKANISEANDDGTIIWVDPTSSAVVCYEFPPSGEKSQLKQIPMPPAQYIEKCMAGAPTGEDSYTIWLQKNQPAFVGPNVQFVTEPGRCRYYGYDMIISMNDPFYSVNVISYGKRTDGVQSTFRKNSDFYGHGWTNNVRTEGRLSATKNGPRTGICVSGQRPAWISQALRFVAGQIGPFMEIGTPLMELSVMSAPPVAIVRSGEKSLGARRMGPGEWELPLRLMMRWL